MKRTLLISLLTLFLCFQPCLSKKVKTTFKIEKDRAINSSLTQDLPGKKVTLSFHEQMDSISGLTGLENISFSGFEKEANSSKETFLISNGSEECLIGFTIRIDYLDLKDRMLHSREVTEKCFVPAGETRKIDIKAWDLQHTYYYYLGNEPKKVATPFKVNIIPIVYWIEE